MLDILEQDIDNELRQKIRENSVLLAKLGKNLKLELTKKSPVINEIIFLFKDSSLEFWIENIISCDRVLETRKPVIELRSNRISIGDFN